MKDLFRYENLNFNNYSHGGSRVLLENGKDRQLICDTYGDKNDFHEMELKQRIHQTIRDYFKSIGEK